MLKKTLCKKYSFRLIVTALKVSYTSDMKRGGVFEKNFEKKSVDK